MRFGETGPRERRRCSGLLTDTDMTGERRGTTGGPETAGENDEESVRKCFALSGISGVLRGSPGALRELLRQDDRVHLQFIASLLVLVQLLLELQSELSYRFVLDEIHKQLSDQISVKGFLPTFNFLGNLVEAAPNVASNLVTKYVPLLERLCSALFYPDEALKASVLYVWLKLFGTAGGLAAQSLPTAIRDRVCILLLQTLANANSPQLIKNCVGLLSVLLQLRGAVTVLMSSNTDQIMCHENQNIHADQCQVLSQDQEQHCSLPLMLKKLLMSGDEMLQATSARCIASVLVHSQCSAPFIQADVPEFLFDRLAGSQSETLLWSVYSCLILLTEDPLFFSQCHSVYGIDSIVRSLKEALQLTNLEVPRQGLLLLTEILERQPPSQRLFPSGSGFEAVSEALLGGVSCSCLLVATQAANAASALFRLNHQSRPVQYGKIEGLIEAITSRYSELPLPSPARHRSSVS
ncbi:Meiosis inhibitor protein 1 [Liparis tanakae]|uniref:Meiosis inhibitor protein 1 n=1 Tax=Liparis tanakae TaxID=230148 RepID=A0A4Z2H0S6_9TELE|nr:Meiosis inhibitor protein 1 [Liparis tanakae]